MLVLEHVSPATRLLEKRRQMFEVQEVLDQQKAGFDRKEEIFKRQEDGLKKKDLDLQESLIKFSKFLQENDSKINRAEKKAREEIVLRQQKELEIVELESQLEALKRECDQVNEVGHIGPDVPLEASGARRGKGLFNSARRPKRYQVMT